MKMPENPPDMDTQLKLLQERDPALILNLLNFASPLDTHGKYRHWDKLKYLDLPEDIDSHEVWWALIKLARRKNYKTLPIKGVHGINFKYSIIDDFQKRLHHLDQFASGNISLDKPILNSQMKNTYLVSSLIEEAITSSQLEGATTTREIAKKMIREQRKPRDRSERMILNNYKAIQFVRSVKKEKLTPNLILDIHKIISDKTLDKPDKTGIFRNEEDNIHVIVDNDQIVFTPPKYTEIESRINELCEFANNENFTDFFIHPVIKAIFIHFYFAYVHPFVDGNGRTARALFYWFMLKKGYWLTEFISISRILKQAPSKYATSFLYTETDDNDLSYFISYQLEVIKRAIDELNDYIKRKMQKLVDIEKIIKETELSNQLNVRQLSLIRHAIKSPGYVYTINEHRNYHDIAYETARKDLINLADEFKLLAKVKEGKSFIFIAPSDLINRINGTT
jgi:Fic family protein